MSKFKAGDKVIAKRRANAKFEVVRLIPDTYFYEVKPRSTPNDKIPRAFMESDLVLDPDAQEGA